MLVVLDLREGARRETFWLLIESERSDCKIAFTIRLYVHSDMATKRAALEAFDQLY